MLHYVIFLPPTRVINLCLSFLIFVILSETSSGAHYQYESCGMPSICGNGLNVTYPFYISGTHESYCGYPGFGINCSQNGFPVLQLPGSGAKYVVEHIFDHNRSIRVYDSAVSGLVVDRVNGSWRVNGSFPSEDGVGGCLPIIRNSTLPTWQLQFASQTTKLHLIWNCTASLSNATRFASTVICNDTNRPRPLAIFGEDNEYLRDALENCAAHVVAPVEGVGNILVALRRGVVLNWTASDCDPCQNSGGSCGFDDATNHFMCFCPDRPHSTRCYPIAAKADLTLPLVIGSTAVLTITAVIVIFILVRRKNIMRNKTKTQMEIELFLRNHENLAPKRYEYKKLKKITNSFSDCIGKGGYGSVYRGVLGDGRVVAVKILNESKGNGEDFLNEVASISTTSHVNIVSLLGFCAGSTKRALIYEFMPNGSLEEFIHNLEQDRDGMGKMLEIAVGIARGLEYLHQGCNTRILHLDIKPHNILLDKDLKPKIADFGLAKLCPNRASIVSMVVARGTIGYIAPEVFCRNFGDVSHKSDVYSFGMMVLKMVGKRNDVGPAVDGTSEVYFPHNIYKELEVDVENGRLDGNDVSGDESQYAKRKLTIVGLWCIQTDPKNRPSMTRVVEMLEGKLEYLQVPPEPHLFSPEPSQTAQDFSYSQSIYSRSVMD
ncbi:hypothetical protein OROGR_003940 [Orobanche gracilis]